MLCPTHAGASGLAVEDGWVDVPATPVPEIVDTNGAGDAFFAGSVFAWHGGRGLPEAMRAGAEASAAVAQSPDLEPLASPEQRAEGGPPSLQKNSVAR